MKKILINLVFIFVLFLPFNIYAKNKVDDYYIDATVQNNGDLLVKELIVVSGTYNGYERIINYSNSNAQVFDGTLSSYNGSDIYNGDGITLSGIKIINVDGKTNYDDLYKSGIKVDKVISASNGDVNVYTERSNYDGITYRIYNPISSSKSGFYIEYTIKNMGVVHNDIAEIGWNLFTSEQSIDIDNLEMIINIPNNKDELRAWGHGPLNGLVEIINKNKIKVTITDLKANTAFDTRFVFDKQVISGSTKLSNKTALDSILTVEGKKADAANEQREAARAELQREKTIGKIIDVILGIYLIMLGLLIRKIYLKYDKEYSSTFKTKYFRDIPANYGPSTLKYLLSKQIGSNELSSSLLNLIADKFVKFEATQKKDYLLKKDSTVSKRKLLDSEEKLLDWFFNEIGNGDEVNLKQIKDNSKKHYEKFLNNYNEWKASATAEAIKENFYEDSTGGKAKGILFSILGICISFVGISYEYSSLVSLISIIISIASLIYFISFTKRTVKGNEDYLKWMGLKNFIKDFGQFKERDLPQISLWEKYLVYASVFGLAEKLSETMKIKFQEINPNYNGNNMMFDLYYFNTFGAFNRSINNSVSGAVNSALSARSIAESRNSSGGGFGGGFSGGGGGFGGGGGGGTF